MSETKSRLSAAKAGFAGKTAIFIVTVFIGLLATGCSGTTNLSLGSDKSEQDEGINYGDYRDDNEGAEVTLSLKDRAEIYGELLSVRDSTLIICTEYSAIEEELAKGVYPIFSIKGQEIQKITVEGKSEFWESAGYGALIGAAVGVSVGFASGDDESGYLKLTAGTKALLWSMCLSPIGAITGGIVGAGNSTADVIIHVPPEYDFSSLDTSLGSSLNSLLNQLSRYTEKEPEYLRAIK
ncbi:MAG: hypothetical protein IH852_02925 [Bacteroidetes bacterium]|nr:hypothetical protein [Bacteroidota bacterium]